MHVYRKIEIPSSFSVTLVIIQLFFVLMVLKWKASAAKKEEEIRKLVMMAAHETSMVEAEYMSNSSKVTAPQYQCVVCFSDATKRCSRCKAVRYCSGKCQIMHWRQGHKEECQPLDICSSSLPSVSTQKNELDLASALLESNKILSSQCNLQEKKVFSSPVKISDHFASEKPEISSSNFPRFSSLHINDEAPCETPCNNATESIPCVNSTSKESPQDSLSGTLTVDVPMPVMPNYEISASEFLTGCRLHTSNILSSSVAIAKDFIPAAFDSINAVLDIFDSQISPKDSSLSVASESPIDYLTSSVSSEHDHDSYTNLEHTSSIYENHTLDHHINKNLSHNFRNSSNFEHNTLASESPLHNSIGTKSHGMDASRHSASINDCPGNIPVLDDPCWRSFVDDSPHPGISSSTSENCNGRLWQFSDNASCSSNDISESQSVMPTDPSRSVSQHGLQSCDGSLSRGTFRRSIGTAFQYFSKQKAKASSPTVSSHVNSCNNVTPSSTYPLIGSSQNISSGFKKSVKKVLRRAKSSKTSKQTNSRTVEKVIAKPSQMLFPYEYFVELFNCTTVELYPCGLINCGNSCYANVVLQCLTYTRPLAAYLLQGYHSEYCKRKNWCLMCDLEHLILMVRESKSPVSPTRILSRIQMMRTHLAYGRQEDAHEVLRLSIDAMQSICLDEAGGEKAVNPTMQKTTFIQQMFGGCLLSKVRCMRCHYESDRFEDMLDLTVEIHGNIDSLEDALAQFTTPELLDGENKYKCERCKSYVKAKKRLIVHEAPNILTIALKRFKNGKFGKLNKHVTFPEFLDLSPYMSGTADEPPLYTLYAVIVHLDMLNASFFGHYVCYVKDSHGTWYKIDDTEVQPVQIDTVMAEGAYMLLYSRSSPRPPYVLDNGNAQACMAAPLDHQTYDSWQSFVTNGHNGSFDINALQSSSLNLRATRIDEIDSDIVLSSNEYANHVCLSDTHNVHAYSFIYDNIHPVITDWDINSTSREYTDFTYSDTGSLFSGSDETSWSTDSYRDSISTVGSC